MSRKQATLKSVKNGCQLLFGSTKHKAVLLKVGNRKDTKVFILCDMGSGFCQNIQEEGYLFTGRALYEFAAVMAEYPNKILVNNLLIPFG
ncbi:hypothetical protein [Rufibacter sp. LB8]|uniref:hypothetical protein n=1 Tax=Rufibacter sp. LB8 TaxID=2777781 RepID=UPI00178C6E1A|nr:hypothetical protein [Rufibacter sp. LB8]